MDIRLENSCTKGKRETIMKKIDKYERAVILNLSRFSRIIERAFLPMLPVAPSIEMFVCMSSPN